MCSLRGGGSLARKDQFWQIRLKIHSWAGGLAASHVHRGRHDTATQAEHWDIMTEGRGTDFKIHQSLAMARLMKQYLSAFHRFSSDESIRYNFYIIKLLDSQQNIYKWERQPVARAAQRFQSQQLRKLIIPDWINNWDSSFRYKMLSGAWYDQYKINILPHTAILWYCPSYDTSFHKAYFMKLHCN